MAKTIHKDIFVAIIDDDPFALNWMGLLIVRDWRTRLIGEFHTLSGLLNFLENSDQHIDVLILDNDLGPGQMDVNEIYQALIKKTPTAKVIITNKKQLEKSINSFNEFKNINGYIIKHEIGFSLNWAVVFVQEGYQVFTPSTEKIINQVNYASTKKHLVIEGKGNIPGLTPHEANIARMAFIYSLGRRDIADEIKVSEQWSYSIVSEIYKKIGLTDILNGDWKQFDYYNDNKTIKNHLKNITEQLGSSHKAKDMEILAYHLITMPEIMP